jgi:hypothetical protein
VARRSHVSREAGGAYRVSLHLLARSRPWWSFSSDGPRRASAQPSPVPSPSRRSSVRSRVTRRRDDDSTTTERRTPHRTSTRRTDDTEGEGARIRLDHTPAGEATDRSDVECQPTENSLGASTHSVLLRSREQVCRHFEKVLQYINILSTFWSSINLFDNLPSCTILAQILKTVFRPVAVRLDRGLPAGSFTVVTPAALSTHRAAAGCPLLSRRSPSSLTVNSQPVRRRARVVS